MWKFKGPSVVSAVKSGARDPRRRLDASVVRGGGGGGRGLTGGREVRPWCELVSELYANRGA